MEEDKTQALFLVDCASPDHTKAICLSCTRALLYLTKFPHQQTANKRLQWNFKLFSSRWQLPLRLHSKTTHFQDLSSDNLDVFFNELDKCIDSTKPAQRSCSTPPVQLLYNALAASVQDLPWDAPDIASPVLSHTHIRKGRRRKPLPKQSPQKKNFIFIVSACPQSVEELSVFSGGVTEDLGGCVRGRLLPTPLLSQLEGRGITLHWIHHNTHQHADMAPPTLISELLAVTGGTLIPMATLIGHTITRDQVESKAAKKVTKSTLVASLFPSSLYLDKYLRSDWNTVKLTKEQNMYWLTTAGGILCACELKSMYHTTRKNDHHRDSDSISQTVPRIVIVGVVQQTDVPLPSLYPTSSCSCVSRYIPREIRTQYSPLTMDPLDTAPLTLETAIDTLDTVPLTMDPLDTAPLTMNPLETAPRTPIDNLRTPENTCLLKRIFKSPEPHRPIDLLCLSPAIHLPRLPFTPPGPRPLSHIRKRCKSAPIVKTPLSQLLRRSVTVDVERCPLLRARRSVSLSPRYPKLQLRKIVKPSTPVHQVPHPGECVGDGRPHSRHFQTLCLWLAKKRYFLVLRVCAQDGGSCVSVMQPVSSLLATVTSVKPQYQDALISKLIKLEDVSLSPQQHTHPGDSSPQQHTHPGDGDPGDGDPGDGGPGDGDPRTVSDAELVGSISLLSTSSVGTVRPFTHQTLLPWLAYSHLGGLDSVSINSLSGLHCEDDGRATARLDLIAQLKTEYSCQALSSEGKKGRPSEEERGGKATEGQEVGVVSVAELRGWFQQCYQDQVETQLDQEAKGDALQRWASIIVPQYAANFTALVANGDHQPSNQNDDIQAELWAELNSSVLVSGVSLSTKYDHLFKTLHNHGEDDGNKDREEVIAGQRLSEYLLQVLLRFEAMKTCPGSCTDGQAYSDLLLFLLRKISLLSNPGLLGRLMKRTVLPLYVSSCRDVLLELYESLMLPLPFDLNPDPESGVESVGGASQESSEEGGSMAEPLQPPTIINTRRLARHASFQDNQRQISVLSKKKRKSRKKKKVEKCSRQELSADTALAALRRSPRLMRTDTAESGRGGVCRSLFTRSLSVCDASLKRPPTHEGDGERQPKRKRTTGLRRHSTMAAEVLVKETPIKKQVEHYQRFKLARLRSKSTVTSPDVVAIEESPRRSFYSKSKITRVLTADSAHFKTPPLKETAQVLVCTTPASPHSLLVCKEPSPASLHSLLHGEILTHRPPHTTPHSHISRPVFTEPPLKQPRLANQSSPLMFSSPLIEKDDCNVIGRTPSKGGPSVVKTPLETSSWSTGRTARMLTYDNQLSKQKLEPPSPPKTTPPCTPEEERTILDIPSLYTPHTCTEPGPWNVPEVLTGIDPSIDTESASMMAFALCTPTKEDRRDFHEAFID